MATTTAVFGWPVPDNNDSPTGPQQMSDLADAIEGTVNRTVTVGAGIGTALADNAWTLVSTVTITLPQDTVVDIVGWVGIINTGAGRPVTALQVLDGSTHLFGTARNDVWGTGDATGTDRYITTPRRSVGLTAGSHTLNLKAFKDANGTLAAQGTQTIGSQAIAATGIEATY